MGNPDEAKGAAVRSDCKGFATRVSGACCPRNVRVQWARRCSVSDVGRDKHLLAGFDPSHAHVVEPVLKPPPNGVQHLGTLELFPLGAVLDGAQVLCE